MGSIASAFVRVSRRRVVHAALCAESLSESERDDGSADRGGLRGALQVRGSLAGNVVARDVHRHTHQTREATDAVFHPAPRIRVILLKGFVLADVCLYCLGCFDQTHKSS